MNKKLLLVGGIIALLAGISGNEINNQLERKAAIAEFKQLPVEEIVKRKVGEEIKSLRTTNSETFKAKSIIVERPEGAREVPQFNVHSYAKQKYWVDADADTLRPLDLSIHKVTGIAELNPLKDFDCYVDAGPYTVTWKESTPYDYTMYIGDDSIEYKMKSSMDSTIIDTSFMPDGVKQTTTLNNSYAELSREWKIKTDGELVLEDNGDVTIQFDGRVPFRILKPTGYDANGVEVESNFTINGDILTVNTIVLPSHVYPITVDPSTVVNTLGGTYSGYTQQTNATYVTARGETTADAVYTNTVLKVGQIDSAGIALYPIRRSFIAFPIGYMLSCSACTLYAHGNTDYSTDDFNVCLFSARSYKSILTTADCDQFDGWQAGGTAYNGHTLNAVWNSSSFTTGATWNKIIFNSVGRDSVIAAKSDTLWIAVISAEDSAASVPTNPEQIDFDLSTSAPYLSYTYTLPTINLPTNFLMLPIISHPESLALSWTNNWSASIDSLVLYRWPDSLRVSTLVKTASSTRIGGLDPFTRYRWYIRADSAGVYGYSNADSCWTAQTLKTENFYLKNYGTIAVGTPNATYAVVRGEADDGDLAILGATEYIGQTKSGGLFRIFRHYQSIPMPAMRNAIAESLFLKVDTDSSAADFNITGRSGLWSAGAKNVKKYYTFDGWQSGTTAYTGNDLFTPFTTAGIHTGATLDTLIFTKAGRDTTIHQRAISDSLKFVFLSSKDISSTEPGYGEWLGIDPANSYIRITYAPPDTVPGTPLIYSISTDSLRVSWTDRSYSETGYMIVNSDGSYLNTTELEGSGVATADTVAGAGHAAYVFDNNLTSSNNWQVASPYPHWLKYDFGAGNAKIVTRYRLLVNDTTTPVRGPSDWIFQASNDTTGAWTNLDWRAKVSIADSVWTSWYEFHNITTYRFYRWYFTHGNSSDLIIRLTEAEMRGNNYCTTAANDTTIHIGGLDINTRYDWKIKVLGGGLNGQYSNVDSCYTWANIPAKPDSVVKLTSSLWRFIINVNGNPSYTKFAVQDSFTNRYIDFTAENESLYVTPFIGALPADSTWGWRTFADMGGATGDTLFRILYPGEALALRAIAKSGR